MTGCAFAVMAERVPQYEQYEGLAMMNTQEVHTFKFNPKLKPESHEVKYFQRMQAQCVQVECDASFTLD